MGFSLLNLLVFTSNLSSVSIMVAATKKKAASGPGYYDLIKQAILELKERNGSSRQAIDKFVSSKKGVSYTKPRLNLALKRGVESGKLVAVKGSFKLSAAEKKPPAKKKAATKKKDAPKKKKLATKKKTVKKKTVKKTIKKKTVKKA